MSKRNNIKSIAKMSRNHSKKSVKLDNLCPSSLHISSCTRCSNKDSKDKFSKILSLPSTGNWKSYRIPKQLQLSAELPRNAAVHFGNFYGLQSNRRKIHSNDNYCENLFGEDVAAIKKRSEFTKQMMNKLERTIGTEDYARQVSTLLHDIVEPPNFKLYQLLANNSILYKRRRLLDYPLWYKEPYKMPLVFSNPIM